MSVPDDETNVPAAAALMEERRRFEQWITALENRRDTTPAHVYSRVHADYERRLAEVNERLTSHADALTERATELRAAIESSSSDEQHRRDERAELELRAHVGELSEQEFADAVADVDATIATLTTRQATLRTELEGIEALLATVHAPRGGTPAQSQEVMADAEPEPLRMPTPATSMPGLEQENFTESPNLQIKSGRPSQGIVRDPSLFDDEASDDEDSAPPETVVAPAADEPGVDAHPGPDDGDESRRSVTPSNTFDELAFLNTIVSGDSTGAQPQAPATRASQSGQSDEPSGHVIRPSGESLAANVTGNHPIVLRPAAEGNAQQKSLKCGECGTLNYPTDWYCERCGAELAAL